MNFSNYFYNNHDENFLYPTQLDYDLMAGYDPGFSDLIDMDQLKQFQDIKVEDWTSYHVFDWIADTAMANKLCYNSFNAASYKHIDGKTLKKMTRDHWADLAQSPEGGSILFQAKQSLFDEMFSLERLSMPHENYTTFTNSHETSPKTSQVEQQQCDSNQIPTVVEAKTKNGRGRPPKLPRTDHRPNRKPYGKIWEFLDKLLSNKETCPSLIKWDDYKTGTFKFVQPKKVAELWGLRKNNKNMDYNKFTRALRYHYKKGFLNSVEEKRLVYKFGPRVIELRNRSQNTS